MYGELYSTFLMEGTLNLKLSSVLPVTSPLPESTGISSSPLFLKDKSVPKIPPWQWKQSPPVKLLKEDKPAFSSGLKKASPLKNLSYLEFVETIVLKNCAIAFAAWIESGSRVPNAS